MVKARKYVVKNHFKSAPKRDDYEVVEYELPPLQDKEILVKVEWISVDPYQRAYNTSNSVSYDQFGLQVGTVQGSKDSDYPVGTKVVTHQGWSDYTIVKAGGPQLPLRQIYKLPDLKGH